jgi:FtsP/CotA-like multicopper oxidase with cupredoxin domain
MKYCSTLAFALGIFFFCLSSSFAAVREYSLVISQDDVSIHGKTAYGMKINGRIPGPTLYFENGDLARIHVKNEMKAATSMHWHGLLVPPTMDGVPFVTQVPIQPGTTFTYEFPIRQTGTYWYHSHSGLQEQQGLYGSIVIPDKQHRTARDYVILLSDWTTESPGEVMRTLKRGSHWYALEKGSSQSIVGAASAGHLGDYFKRELQRMPPMDIADIAYDFFLSNGLPQTGLEAKPDEKVRLRIINGSATTYFHLNYSGGSMTIISADGQLVEPVESDLFLIGVAETYDVIITLPSDGAFEFRATAHDGSGHTSAWIGSGTPHPAKNIPMPNLYEPMKHNDMGSLFALTPAGTMGMPDSAVEAGMFDKPGMSHEMHDAPYSDPMMDHGGHGGAHGGMKAEPVDTKKTEHLDSAMPLGNHQSPDQHQGMGNMKEPSKSNHALHPLPKDISQSKEVMEPRHSMPMKNNHSTSVLANQELDVTNHEDQDHPQSEVMNTAPGDQINSSRPFGKSFGLLVPDISSHPYLASEGGPERPQTPYHQLKSSTPSHLPTDAPLREVRLTLDGDMQRYTWFINNRPVSETDSIRIEEGEIVRFIMINRTMMHHPMHLHGHFFRVLNGQKDYAPLKHTVDVAPMSTTVIEFYGNEVGDWFFHCHLLYHMKAGMARLVSYNNYTPPPEVSSVRSNLYRDPFYFYGTADILHSMTEGSLNLANSRWDLTAGWEVGWQGVEETDWEGLVTADYYLNRFTSIFGGINVFGEGSNSEAERGVVGFSYLLPLNFDFAAWADTEGGGRLIFEKELELTPRLALHGEVEYDTHEQWEGKVRLGYLISKEFSLLANWHSEYGIGVGLQVRF